MNFYIILGIILIALGTLFTYYGSHVKTKAVNEISKKEISGKIEEVLTEIEGVKKSQDDETKKQDVEKIEDEFKIWAKDFVQNLDKKKVDFEKKKIENKQLELELSSKWRQMYVIVFEYIKSLIKAFNQQSEGNISYNFPKVVPKNIFLEDFDKYQVKITFNSDNLWIISLRIPDIIDGKTIPVIKIDHYNEEKGIDVYSFTCHISIHFDLDDNKIGVYEAGTDPLIFEDKKQYELDNYEDVLKSIFKKAFENQIVRL